ncbi:MAG: hypothetical protein R3E32_26110 [Chitinophagales bacterium]
MEQGKPPLPSSSPKTNLCLVVESTLSGNCLLKVVQRVKAQGYQISLVYIFLDSPETCIQRVRARVLKGGHHIPDEDVIRRYYRSIRQKRNRLL